MKIAGKKVRNAQKPVALIITSNDVKKGAAKDPGACAAALACMRQLGATAARVHTGRTYVEFTNEWVRYNTPVALQKELVAFDRGGSFEPGEYLLRPLPVSQSRRLGKRQGSKETKAQREKYKNGKSPKRKVVHVTSGIRAHGANR